MLSRRSTTSVFLALGTLLLLARLGWELLSPVAPQEFKGLLYARDLVTVLPATVLLLLGFRRAKPQSWLTRLLEHGEGRWPVLCGLIAFCACLLMTTVVYWGVPHIVDESTYLLQARTYAEGAVVAQPPADGEAAFASSLTVMDGGRWYGVFFPLWPVLLVPAVLLGVEWLVPALMVGILVWLTYASARKLFGKPTAVAASLLLVTSPFLYLQGGSFFSHTLAAILVLVAVTRLLWKPESTGSYLIAGSCVAALLLARPLTAVAVGVFALAIWWRSSSPSSGRKPSAKLLGLVLTSAVGVLAFALYNLATTGDPALTPHDKLLPHNLGLGSHLMKNSAVNAVGFLVDSGFAPVLVVFLLALGITRYRTPSMSYLGWLSLGTMAGYGLYKYHGFSYGPRFYFDVFPLVLIVSGHVLASMLQELRNGVDRPFARASLALAAFAPLLMLVTLAPKAWTFYKRGEIFERAHLAELQIQGRAVVFLDLQNRGTDEERIDPYIGGLFRNDPKLQNRVIYANWRTELAQQVRHSFPDRQLYRLQLDDGKLTRL